MGMSKTTAVVSSSLPPQKVVSPQESGLDLECSDSVDISKKIVSSPESAVDSESVDISLPPKEDQPNKNEPILPAKVVCSPPNDYEKMELLHLQRLENSSVAYLFGNWDVPKVAAERNNLGNNQFFFFNTLESVLVGKSHVFKSIFGFLIRRQLVEEDGTVMDYVYSFQQSIASSHRSGIPFRIFRDLELDDAKQTICVVVDCSSVYKPSLPKLGIFIS